jgi:hypothetical protein
MCRYGFKNYKLTYACFTCNVGFKRPNLADVQANVADILQKKAEKEGVNMPANIHDAKCPNCSNEMANLGRDLRLPAKTKKEQWQCIKYLYDNNYNIYSCGCSGIGFVPHKMKDAIELIEEFNAKKINYAMQVVKEFNRQNSEAKRK